MLLLLRLPANTVTNTLPEIHTAVKLTISLVFFSMLFKSSPKFKFAVEAAKLLLSLRSFYIMNSLQVGLLNFNFIIIFERFLLNFNINQLGIIINKKEMKNISADKLIPDT